jgi:hypothetical protein
LKPQRNTETLSTKVSGDLAERLDQIALFRGTTRSGLLRQLAEAAVDHRVVFSIPASNPMTVAELAASDVGRAALARAQRDVAAACSDRRAARGVGAAVRDPVELANELIEDRRRGLGERRQDSERS